MVKDSNKEGWGRQDAEDFRALQEEMLQLSREYSQARLAVWVEEAGSLQDNWAAFSRDWQHSLDEMAARAVDKFAEITSQGEAAGSLLSQSFRGSFQEISGDAQDWGENLLKMMERVAQAWAKTFAGGESGEDWSFLFGGSLDLGGWFHQGGIVEAHQGMVVSPETLQADEQLVLAQTGEGILPRESMARLGEKNFEALRTGRFDMNAGAGTRYDITIQVQSLDAQGVAGLDWDRLVQRHILPALQKDLGQRW